MIDKDSSPNTANLRISTAEITEPNFIFRTVPREEKRPETLIFTVQPPIGRLDLPVLVRVTTKPGVQLPEYETSGAAGMDIRADDSAYITPGMTALVPTGISVALPPGVEAQVRPRSGLAHRASVTVLNAPGTIDSDFRGEIAVLLINHGTKPFRVRKGDRIAQLVFAPVLRCEWEPAEQLSDTARGVGGFGSTGVK
jgi:dUTP pyrophosphatase